MREKIIREKRLVEETVKELNKKLIKNKHTQDEIVAMSKYIYDIYSGMENILKIYLKTKGKEIPSSITWHRDLLEISHSAGIISREILEKLQELLGFRHIFAHGYAVRLRESRVKDLCEETLDVWLKFVREIEQFSEIDTE
ncbi:MAG: HepT-like ribonuclease domain-containing protein [Candidatus Edwardsbacteria bacterium]